MARAVRIRTNCNSAVKALLLSCCLLPGAVHTHVEQAKLAKQGNIYDQQVCDLAAVCKNPARCAVLAERPPDVFDVVFETTAGSFTIRTTTAWAPPFATRFWHLSRLRYMQGARFYRVDYVNPAKSWVVQFGYRGEPNIDQCWDAKLSSNATWSVHLPGNIRSTVAFSMDAVNQSHRNPNCTAEDYCAQGFSTNIYINYANNSRLDAHGFAVFGVVLPPGMSVVDKLYSGYGEVCDLCPVNGMGNHYDQFCKGFGRDCKGVNMTRLVSEGEPYLKASKPRLDRIISTQITHSNVGDAVLV